MPSAWQGIELFPKWKELNPPSPGRARPHDFPHDSDSLGRQFCKNPHVLRISAEHPQIFRTYSRTTSRTTRRRPPPGRLGSRKPGAFPFYGSSKIFNFIAAAPFLPSKMCNFYGILCHFISLTQHGILWRAHIREPRPSCLPCRSWRITHDSK